MALTRAQKWAYITFYRRKTYLTLRLQNDRPLYQILGGHSCVLVSELLLSLSLPMAKDYSLYETERTRHKTDFR